MTSTLTALLSMWRIITQLINRLVKDVGSKRTGGNRNATKSNSDTPYVHSSPQAGDLGREGDILLYSVLHSLLDITSLPVYN